MYRKRIIIGICLAASVLCAGHVFAAESFEISGWIPYWRSVEGTASIAPHLNSFTEVNPFMYSVKSDGSLHADSQLSNPEWRDLQTKARALGIRFIPSVAWSDPDAIDDVLRDPLKRSAHVKALAREVYAYSLDGIDINYEAKYARTKQYFSQFLKELYDAIGYDKWVMCTIEARTPLSARYSSVESIPSDIEYSNDFKAIGQYCDRVRIMAYDQGRVDVTLNDTHTDIYIPISDPVWVEKVMRLAAQEISVEKLVMGIPTYGYEYDTYSEVGETEKKYSKLWSFNPGYALDLATKLGRSAVRTSAGEMSLEFPAAESPEAQKPLPDATRVLIWSDASAIRKKVELAKTLQLRGVAIFKIDGGQDASIWDIVAQYKAGDLRAKTPDTKLNLDEGNVNVNSSGSVTIPVPTHDLAPGATGEDVKNLQKLLNKQGFTIALSGPGSPGNETAYFGGATYRALVKFQKSRKIIPAVGRLGPLTRKAFQSI